MPNKRAYLERQIAIAQALTDARPCLGGEVDDDALLADTNAILWGALARMYCGEVLTV